MCKCCKSDVAMTSLWHIRIYVIVTQCYTIIILPNRWPFLRFYEYNKYIFYLPL